MTRVEIEAAAGPFDWAGGPLWMFRPFRGAWLADLQKWANTGGLPPGWSALIEAGTDAGRWGGRAAVPPAGPLARKRLAFYRPPGNRQVAAVEFLPPPLGPPAGLGIEVRTGMDGTEQRRTVVVPPGGTPPDLELELAPGVAATVPLAASRRRAVGGLPDWMRDVLGA